MKAKIHLLFDDGSEDCLTISADSIGELRELAQAEVDKRNPAEYWSEVED